MYTDDDDPRKKRRSPFDAIDDMFESMGLDPSEFDRIFRDMERSFMDAMKSGPSMEPGKPFVRGFTFKMGPDGRPRFEQFGNRTPDVGRAGIQMSNEMEPLTDLIESEAEIALTVELPGVEKTDIKVDAKPERVEISVDNDHRKYHKIVRLPAKVDPASTKATYRNGVLDITIRKVDDEDQGVQVSVE